MKLGISMVDLKVDTMVDYLAVKWVDSKDLDLAGRLASLTAGN